MGIVFIGVFRFYWRLLHLIDAWFLWRRLSHPKSLSQTRPWQFVQVEFRLKSKCSTRSYLRDLCRLLASQVLPTCFDHLQDLEMSTNSQSKPLLWGGSTVKIPWVHTSAKCESVKSLIPQKDFGSFFGFRWADLEGLGCHVPSVESVDVVNGGCHVQKQRPAIRLMGFMEWWLQSLFLAVCQSRGPTLIHFAKMAWHLGASKKVAGNRVL